MAPRDRKSKHNVYGSRRTIQYVGECAHQINTVKFLCSHVYCIKLFFYNFYVVKFFLTREINPWGQEEESNEIDRAIVTNRPFSLL